MSNQTPSHTSEFAPRLDKILRRFRPLLYLSAGSWGALLNVLATFFLMSVAGMTLVPSFSIGFFLNALFNIWFCLTYHLGAHQNSRIPEFSISSAVMIHVVLLIVGFVSLWILGDVLEFSVLVQVPFTVMILSLLSLFIGRIWIFVSPFLSEVEYEDLGEGFYVDSQDSEKVGWFRAWYHVGRFVESAQVVGGLYKPGDIVYDFGSGGSEWNRNHLPVIGIDINENLLKHGQAVGQLSGYRVAKLWDTGIANESADIVVISEVLEHMVDPDAVLNEIFRILKPGGHLFITVPWDTSFTPFFWLFNAQCFYRGYIKDEEYYRQRCGHVNHFSKRRLARVLQAHGFAITKLYKFRLLLLYALCKKPS